METPSGIPRLPWARIAVWFTLALACAWGVGFAAGLLARVLTRL